MASSFVSHPASSLSDRSELDTGQHMELPQAGPSGRSEDFSQTEAVDVQEGSPRLRTSLLNQDSVLAAEVQSSGRGMEQLTSIQSSREQGLQSTSEPLLDMSGTGGSTGLVTYSRDVRFANEAAGANGADGGSKEGGSYSARSSGRRDAPAGGPEQTENSSSGSGTNQSNHRKSGFSLTYSGLAKKKPAWQINLSEVELGDLVSNYLRSPFSLIY
jgi:hypothetical protein